MTIDDQNEFGGMPQTMEEGKKRLILEYLATQANAKKILDLLYELRRPRVCSVAKEKVIRYHNLRFAMFRDAETCMLDFIRQLGKEIKEITNNEITKKEND